MKRKAGWILFLSLAVVFPSAWASEAEDAFILLSEPGILQLWWPEQAWLVHVDLPRRLALPDPAAFQQVVAGPQGIFVLDRQGRIFSVLERRLVFVPPFRDAKGQDLTSGRSTFGLRMLDSLGRLHPSDWLAASGPNSPVASLMEGRPCALGEDAQGRLWIVGTAGTLVDADSLALVLPERPFPAEIVDMEFSPSRTGALLLDRMGQLYAWGDALGTEPARRPQFGQPLAVDLEFSPNRANRYYILDRHGAIFCSSPERMLVVPEPSSAAYCGFAAIDSSLLERIWRESFPALSVGIEPQEARIPYWRPNLRFQLNCEQAQDLTEFSCLIEFNPSVLKPRQVYQGRLFQASGRGGAILDDSRSEKGLLEVRGVSLGKRSGSGMSGSGSLCEVDMEILQPGSSTLKVLSFEAASASLPSGGIEVAGISHGFVNIYSAQPFIVLSCRSLPISSSSDENLIPETHLQVRVGERFPVYLQVNHVKGMKGLRYDLSFDANLVELVAVEEGRFLSRCGPTLFLTDPGEVEAGTAWLRDQGIVVLGRGNGANGPGEIARYLFQAVRPGKAAIRLIRAALVDERRVRKTFQISSAQVEVEIAGQN